MIFNIDFDTLVQMLLPVKLRKPRQVAWLKALVAPVATNYATFTVYRLEKEYELANNGQVCYLEKVLNDRFDPTTRSIVVADTPDIDPVYYYLDAENKEEYVYLASEAQPVHYFLEAETVGGPDFDVQVPALVTFDDAELKALVNKYKLVGRAYTITIV